jgi:hypothetical protein
MATVSTEVDGVQQRRTTNDSGSAIFAYRRDVTVSVTVRRLGFIPLFTSVALLDERQTVDLTMRRATQRSLDTVRVTAGRAVSGYVVAAATQTPVADATITLVGSKERIVSAANGAFTMPLLGQRTVTLAVRAAGFAPAFLTERLDNAPRGEYLILLDSMDALPNYIAANLWDAESRIRDQGVRDAIVGGRELRATGASGVLDALRLSPTSNERGLRVDSNVCLFVNGEPAPGQTLETFPVQSVKTIELYSDRGGVRYTGLSPQNAPCGQEQSVGAASGLGAVRYAYVWTY